jgi:hypothetical protein
LLNRALAERRAGTSDGNGLREYRAEYERWLDTAGGALRPGRLLATRTAGEEVLCACSVKDAGLQRCHRTWAAAALFRAGWRVVLDGAEWPQRS